MPHGHELILRPCPARPFRLSRARARGIGHLVIAKVEPLTRARALRGPFDYRVPDRMTGVDVGTVLVIPFGRRRAVGVVVEMAETSQVPDSRLVEPISSLEADLQPE